jgi:hypothetical protein
MRFNPILILLLTFIVHAGAVSAQQSPVLPAVVQQQIDDQTALVARLDLSQSTVAQIDEFLSMMADPTRWFGMRAVDFHHVLERLRTTRVSAPQRMNDVFILLSTSDLPSNGMTFVIPVAGTEADRTAVADSLKSPNAGKTEVVADGVLYFTNKRRVASPGSTGSARPEFAAALAEIKGSHVQIAVSLGPDARRVLREQFPVVPDELGGGAGLPLADGWKWMALGVTLSPKPEIQFKLQAVDAQTAEACEKIITAVEKWALSTDLIKSSGIATEGLLKSLVPIRQGDRLSQVFNEANGGSQRLIEGLGRSLVVHILRNGLRSRTRNNLKQLGLAMHNFHDVDGSFPAPAIRGADGKKLLSWRVRLLPYLDGGALYKEFHLNEPWDSEHNRKLITRMPEVFISANINAKQSAQGLTTYLGAAGERCVFSGPDGTKIKQIKDGTSNTIAVVDDSADRAVYWTQPEDLVVDLKQPLKGLGGQQEGLFQALMCDGSARGIPYTIKPENLRRLFQIDDGETVEEF